MKAMASSFGAWRLLEENEGIKVPHGLTFPLAVVREIGAPHGLEMTAEEDINGKFSFDAIFLSVLDSRCMINAKSHFDKWKIPFRSSDRPIGKWPLVWAGGQGLRNPLPLSLVYDLCVVGDAEDPLPRLLSLWHTLGNTKRFLDDAAQVDGVFVPSVHDRRVDRIAYSISSDISISIRSSISVSHDGTRRLEIARGCRSKCSYCTLGWNVPYRENTTEGICNAVSLSKSRVHLQAGDAEGHLGISEIRSRISAIGGHDQGWTGRLDSILANPDQQIAGNKRYAFGVEATSYRVRRAIGKHELTDAFLVDGTLKLMRSMPHGKVGRLAWHLISGLPTATLSDSRDMLGVLRSINGGLRSAVRNLELHWQPFQPLPGTPMQWCATGHGARLESSWLRDAERLPWLRVRQVTGRTDAVARLCAILSRSDERGVEILEHPDMPVSVAESVSGSTSGEIDVDSPMPWDFVNHPMTRHLRKAYDVTMRKLRG